MSIGSLFAVCTLIWGTTWFAIKFQLGAASPEAGVALRFLVAGVVLMAWCLARRQSLRLSLREHLWLLAQGAATYSISYVLIYHAERHIVSGLVAVGYAAAPLVNLLLSRLFLGTPMPRRVALGGALGLSGIALVFLPELTALSASQGALLGIGLTAVAVLISCTGNVIVAAQTRGKSSYGWPQIAWSMVYGGTLTLAWAVLAGRPLAIEWSPAFVASFLYLSVFGSILAFGAYFTLIARIGAARAAYVGVMSPVLALLVSAAFESFHWRAATFIGIALALAGNLVTMWRPAGRPLRPATLQQSL